MGLEEEMKMRRRGGKKNPKNPHGAGSRVGSGAGSADGVAMATRR